MYGWPCCQLCGVEYQLPHFVVVNIAFRMVVPIAAFSLQQHNNWYFYVQICVYFS